MIKDPHIESWSFNRFQDISVLLSTGVLILAAAAFIITPGWLTYVLLALGVLIFGMIIYFFRDPDRTPIREPGLVVGPADGVVVSIEPFQEGRYLQAETIRVSMFLSLFDVHVQRAPLEGTVTSVDHRPGEFLQAFKPEASDVNEYIAMVIETAYGSLLVKQISGILARRCLNYARPGDWLETGQRFGHIKFGSRVDLFLPADAEILVQIGDKVKGGLTRIAQLKAGQDE